jgi:hypothetical protein
MPFRRRGSQGGIVAEVVSGQLDPAALQRARVAVATLLLTNSAIFANLVPHYPEIKDDLHLSNAVYGTTVAAFSAGALVAGVAAGVLIRLPVSAGGGGCHGGAGGVRGRRRSGGRCHRAGRRAVSGRGL